MEVCWNQNPNDRPSMAQVVRWSQLPELQSLRMIHYLEPAKLLSICQCQVVRDHVHQDRVDKSYLKHVIPNCKQFVSPFSSLSSQTPPSKRKSNISNKHTQIWIAQDMNETATKMTIVTFRSSDLGYYVRILNFLRSTHT